MTGLENALWLAAGVLLAVLVGWWAIYVYGLHIESRLRLLEREHIARDLREIRKDLRRGKSR